MANQHRFFCSRCVYQSGYIFPELLHRIFRYSFWPAGAAITALVRRPHPVSKVGKHRQLSAPAQRMFRKTMQTERQTVTSAAGSDLKGLPIAANEFELDLLTTHDMHFPAP